MRQLFTQLACGFAILAGTCLSALPVHAAGPAPKIDRFRGFLIYDDTGNLSKNVAKETDQIAATDEKGSGTQILVDVIVSGPKNQLLDKTPMLMVVVHGMFDNVGDPAMVDTGYPLNYIGGTGEIVRSLVIDHNCNGFKIDAYLMVGDKKVSELEKTFNITCGD